MLNTNTTKIEYATEMRFFLDQIKNKNERWIATRAFIKAQDIWGDKVAAEKIQKAVLHNCFSDLEAWINS